VDAEGNVLMSAATTSRYKGSQPISQTASGKAFVPRVLVTDKLAGVLRSGEAASHEE